MHRRTIVVLVGVLGASALGCSRSVAPGTPPPGAVPTGNQIPDTWFAGADPADPSVGWQVDTGVHAGRYLDLSQTGWFAFAGVPHSMLSADSLQLLPSVRPQRKTFFEIYDDRLWIRQEGDTVHLGAWVVFPAGGSDPDSPYSVPVGSSRDTVPRYPVLTPGPPNGSPIGFRTRVQVRVASGLVSNPSETTTYPNLDPASVFFQPTINGYWGLTTAGRAYAVLHAVDGDGAVDHRVDAQPGGAVGIVDRVEAGGGSAQDIALRAKILTFYVNHAPILLRDDPTFAPRTNALIDTRTPTFNMPASDDDPFDPNEFYRQVGGVPPGTPPILRWKVAVLGKLAGTARDTCWVDPADFHSPGAIQLSGIPAWIAAGDIVVRVRLCDCEECDVTPGTRTCPFDGHELLPEVGTCVDTDIPCRFAPPPGPARVIAGALPAPHGGRP